MMKNIITVLGIILYLSAPAAFSQDSDQILFKNVKVFDGTSSELKGPLNVFVSGNHIKTISPDKISANENVVKIDGRGKTLMPGLIDVHVHMVQESFPSRKAFINSALKSQNKVVQAVKPIAKADLMQGFTSVRDMGGDIFPVRDAIEAGDIVGPRIWPSGAFISQTAGHGDYRDPDEKSRLFFGKLSKAEKVGYTHIVDSRAEILTAVRENLRRGASQIKVMASGGLSSKYDPIDVVQYTLGEMKAAVEAAEDWGTYVAVHAYSVPAVRRAIKAGVKSIEHGHLLDKATLELMKNKGVWLSFQYLGFASQQDKEEGNSESPASGTQKAKIAKKIHQANDSIWPMAHKIGVKMTWGTDFIYSPTAHKYRNQIILEMQSFLSNAEILKMVTHDNAILLQLSNDRSPYPGELGVIKEGALADILLVNGNPMADLSLIAHPETSFSVIVKDGKIYKKK